MAHQAQYDMLTAPITNNNYHARVLSQLTSHFRALESAGDLARSKNSSPPLPVLRNIDPSESFLTPISHTSQLVLLVSPWIDLCSEDTVVADLSRQVLEQEVAYTAFCGASNIVVRGPRRGASDAGLRRFGKCLRDVLGIGFYLNIMLSVPMNRGVDDNEDDDDLGDLARFAREPGVAVGSFPASDGRGQSDYEAWEAWHIIRSVCNYSSKLFVGKTMNIFLHNFHPVFYLVTILRRLAPSSCTVSWLAR